VEIRDCKGNGQGGEGWEGRSLTLEALWIRCDFADYECVENGVICVYFVLLFGMSWLKG